jgi:hypothetical protein
VKSPRKKKPAPIRTGQSLKQRHLRIIGVANPIDVPGHGKSLCVRKERFLCSVVQEMPPTPDIQARRLMRDVQTTRPATAAEDPEDLFQRGCQCCVCHPDGNLVRIPLGQGPRGNAERLFLVGLRKRAFPMRRQYSLASMIVRTR